MTDAARKHKVASQLGTQIHAQDNYRRVVELIQSGAIGQVSEVHSWVGGDRGMPKVPTDTPPVPSGVNWDLWIGPAPFRPFHSVYFPGPKWYRWWDFGSGTLGNYGCHTLDTAVWALELTVYLFAWLVLFGMSYGVKVHAHLGVDAFVRLFGDGTRRVLGLGAVGVVHGPSHQRVPARLAAGRRDPSVERRPQLERHERPPAPVDDLDQHDLTSYFE